MLHYRLHIKQLPHPCLLVFMTVVICQCRLKSMSDDDLVTVLEQLHQGRFQLPAAAPSLSPPQPSSDTPPSAVAPLKSRNSSSDGPLARPLADRQSATDTPDLSFTLQDGQQTDKQVQPTVTSLTGKHGADQQDAAKSLPDAWQQQTFRLQAFTKPLMQRLQGNAYQILCTPHLRICATLLVFGSCPTVTSAQSKDQ